MDGYAQLAAAMKALAHPVRLQILQVLRKEEACVCHLEAMLGQRQAYISQQLMKLREVGLVNDRRDGLNVFYSLANDAIGPLLDAAERLVGASSEQDVSFDLPPEPAEAACSCPKCETVVVAETQLTDG